MYFLEGEQATENLIKEATEKVVSEAIDQTN
jgi:hypothetical protein